jgi:predicted acyl esterase
VIVPLPNRLRRHQRQVRADHADPHALQRLGRAAPHEEPHISSILGDGDDAFIENGYIRVFQDVRGKYGSEGDYVMTRPLRGPLNDTRSTTAPTPTTPSTGW